VLGYLTTIFCCQLIGELIVSAFGLTVPGPVFGMLLLFLGLVAWGSLPDDLGAVSDGLLQHLSLLFIPAGVGVMLHAGVLGRDWLPISVALVISTLAAIAATAWTMVLLDRAKKAGRKAEERDA
jgi:holin-like protein